MARLIAAFLIGLSGALQAAAMAGSPSALRHPLTIDDVLDTVTLDRVAPSPDGEWVAAVVPRPARAGEMFGRNSYEIDPSRDDVWLVSRRTGERRNLTQGAADAAGFWCATWSPDGQRLAMLSTRPEGNEPRGGDNVHIYIWARTGGAPHRLNARAVMTQGRYGGGLYPLDLRGGAGGGSRAHVCRSGEENAPFAWIDSNHLVALLLPEGEVSALLDQYGRPLHEAARTHAILAEGQRPSATAVGSGAETMPRDERRYRATLAILDARSGGMSPVADIPIYPFGGALTLSIAPDGRRAAILATLGAIAPAGGEGLPYNREDWHVRKRLGFVDLKPGAPIRWADDSAARLPLELLGWSPDGRRVALRARAEARATEASLFTVSPDTLATVRIAASLMIGGEALGAADGRPAALWVDDDRLLASARARGGKRDDWWLVGRDGDPVNVTAGLPRPPARFQRTANGRLVAIADNALHMLDIRRRALVRVPGQSLREGARIAWPDDPGQPATTLLLRADAGGSTIYDRIDPATGRRTASLTLPAPEIHGLDHGAVLWSEQTPTGLFLREADLAGSGQRELLVLDAHLAAVDWGRTMVIDYAGADGHALKAGVILPPDYQAGQRYPVLTWVYGGMIFTGPDDYWFDHYLPGIYNLQLYAAHGYVVLIPSIPLRTGSNRDGYRDLARNVLPAIDRLAALGIADPLRAGLMGQSFGGYTVYALVTQTDRFRAGIALAGITDLAQFEAQFDPGARGYPGIEHEKSTNWSIIQHAYYNFGVSSAEDAGSYRRNSPIAHVGCVRTPLLLAHGELDDRDPLAQAETFFFHLYRQGKTARLLRYWGENHSLALSPANVRDMLRETYRWLDTYVAPPRPEPSDAAPINGGC